MVNRIRVDGRQSHYTLPMAGHATKGEWTPRLGATSGQGEWSVYRPDGSGKSHQLLENPTCTPMPTVYPLQIRPVFVLS